MTVEANWELLRTNLSRVKRSVGNVCAEHDRPFALKRLVR